MKNFIISENNANLILQTLLSSSGSGQSIVRSCDTLRNLQPLILNEAQEVREVDRQIEKDSDA